MTEPANRRPDRGDIFDPQKNPARIGILPGQVQIAEMSGIIDPSWRITTAKGSTWLDIPVPALVNILSNNHSLQVLDPLLEAISESMKNILIDPQEAVRQYDSLIADTLINPPPTPEELSQRSDEIRELSLIANLYSGVAALKAHARMSGIPLHVSQFMHQIDERLNSANLEGLEGNLAQLNIEAKALYAGVPTDQRITQEYPTVRRRRFDDAEDQEE